MISASDCLFKKEIYFDAR